MKTEKLNLGMVKNVLSRSEMKKIMAGSGNPQCQVSGSCPTGLECCPGYDCYDYCTFPDPGCFPQCYLRGTGYGGCTPPYC